MSPKVLSFVRSRGGASVGILVRILKCVSQLVVLVLLIVSPREAIAKHDLFFGSDVVASRLTGDQRTVLLFDDGAPAGEFAYNLTARFGHTISAPTGFADTVIRFLEPGSKKIVSDLLAVKVVGSNLT